MVKAIISDYTEKGYEGMPYYCDFDTYEKARSYIEEKDGYIFHAFDNVFLIVNPITGKLLYAIELKED